MGSPTDRRDGVRLDPAKLDYELARRGLTARRLAELAGCSEILISRARHGGRLREQTLRKIAGALTAVPLLDGADLLLQLPGTPRNTTAAGSTSAAVKGASHDPARTHSKA